MIVDSSALIAIITKEPGYDTLIEKLLASPSAGIGTPTLTETGIVLTSRLGFDAGDLLGRVVAAFEIVPVPFGEDHWREAVRAYARYGRGRHQARLNFGDCLSYAIARLAGEPLLFVGTDFGLTDLERSLRSTHSGRSADSFPCRLRSQGAVFVVPGRHTCGWKTGVEIHWPCQMLIEGRGDVDLAAPAAGKPWPMWPATTEQEGSG